MIDYAQSFEEFSRSLKPMDIAIYAGIGIIIYVLFKERLSPIQKLVSGFLDQAKIKLGSSTVSPNTIAKPVIENKDNNLFFQLVTSWKQTRDLAVKSGCSEAVKVADQMFPYLSPTVCKEENI